jgi:RecA/RadA recombinase
MKTINLDVLLQGKERARKIELLLKFSGKTSDTLKIAVAAHLVDGMAKSMVHMVFGISQQQLDKALADINQTHLEALELKNIM